jgi:glycosyltransferase involved in cell wall biosynthesis
MLEVSVLMAVHNGERHLRAAVDSILSQTYGNFEFLIIDDGSSDRTAEIVASYTDPRIRSVVMGRNVGLSAALNEGLRLARGRLIARQDADDLSEPRRLERQVSVMSSRSDLALLGSQGVALSEDGRPTGFVRRCTTPAAIRWCSVFDNPFIHT